jgi:hypothetical protein
MSFDHLSAGNVSVFLSQKLEQAYEHAYTQVKRHTAKQIGMYSKRLIGRQFASCTDSFLGCSKVFGQMSFDHLSGGNVSVFVFESKTGTNLQTDEHSYTCVNSHTAKPTGMYSKRRIDNHLKYRFFSWLL